MKIEIEDEYLEKLNKEFEMAGYDPIESEEGWKDWIKELIDSTIEGWFGGM